MSWFALVYEKVRNKQCYIKTIKRLQYCKLEYICLKKEFTLLIGYMIVLSSSLDLNSSYIVYVLFKKKMIICVGKPPLYNYKFSPKK